MKIWGLQQISPDEKANILSQHREIYNGYRTLQPNVPSEQPLYVQDFAKDKVGAVLNNKGVVKGYTNVGINEQVESKEVCDECGSMMMEGECMECGWKGEVGEGEMEESWGAVARFAAPMVASYIGSKMGENNEEVEEDSQMCSECGGAMLEGECSECGYVMEETMEGYDTGKLSDIYNVEDLGDNEFDYVEGGGNDYGTFEKMHHMRKLKNEQSQKDYEDPDNEDDGFEDIQAGEELEEQGYTGGGNAPDMDLSNIKPAYDFISDGPDEVYPTESELEENDDFMDFEQMESAWSDDELNEYDDISGAQGIYGDMKPAYDFDSEGPGKAGPYQRRYDFSTSDDDEGELEIDFEKFDPRDKSWEEITAYTGEDEFSHLDEEVKEKFVLQKNRIHEMFSRMNSVK